MDEQPGTTLRDSDQTHIDFLDSELDLSSTFLNCALSHRDEPDVMAYDLQKAREGFETASRWIGRVRDVGHFDRLMVKLEDLRERLDRVRDETPS